MLCTRVEDGSDPESSGSNDVGPYYFHPFDEVRLRRPTEMPAPPPTVERAPADVRDRAYRAVLADLRLEELDREGLRARGLDDAHITANGYRTLHTEGRARLALVAINAVGEALAPLVPGVYWKEDGNRGWWTFGGSSGLLIPVRDLEGRIIALKSRSHDAVVTGSRYSSVSSYSHGGPKAELAAHVPIQALDRRESSNRLVITEGELKADVSTALTRHRVPVVSVPGVSSWRLGLDLARRWGAPAIDIAFDMDQLVNEDVARALKAMLAAFRGEGFDVGTVEWPPRYKGLDDYLLARSRGEV